MYCRRPDHLAFLFRLAHSKVATAAFWRTFSDEGKISPGWWGWGVHAHLLSLHLPSPVKLQCTLQLSGQIHWPCFISTNICTLWASAPNSVPPRNYSKLKPSWSWVRRSVQRRHSSGSTIEITCISEASLQFWFRIFFVESTKRQMFVRAPAGGGQPLINGGLYAEPSGRRTQRIIPHRSCWPQPTFLLSANILVWPFLNPSVCMSAFLF